MIKNCLFFFAFFLQALLTEQASVRKEVKKIKKELVSMQATLDDLDAKNKAAEAQIQVLQLENEELKKADVSIKANVQDLTTFLGETKVKVTTIERAMNMSLINDNSTQNKVDAWFNFNNWSQWGPCDNEGIRTRERTCEYESCISFDSNGHASFLNAEKYFDQACLPTPTHGK